MSAEQLITKHLDIWTSAHKTRSSAGRGSSSKLDLYGIKKLRELILELAVRGKLVPQDPNDEPASELFTRISLEKEQLLKDGKIKKDKSSPEITVNESPNDIPSNWYWSNLKDLAIINPRNYADDELEVSFIPMTLIDTRFDGGHEQERRLWKEIKQGFTHFAEGDIAIAKITPCFENSKACVFKNLTNLIGAGTTELHIVRPIGTTLNPRYVLAYLKSPSFLSIGETRMTGTAGQKRLPKDFIEYYPFALPPIAEQHRIVGKVDELMAFCDQLEQAQTDNIAAHAQLVEALLTTLTNSKDHQELQTNWQRIAEHFDTLFTTEDSIDQLKQTILQLAVMGKLVSQDPNDEPASEFLKKIAAEKAQLIKEGKIKKENPLLDITDEEIPFELPNGWQFERLENLVHIQSGITKGRNLSGRKVIEVPYLSVANVQRSYLDLKTIKTVEIGTDEYEKYSVQNRDLLITEGGDWDKVGRTAIWNGELPFVAHQNHVFKARLLLAGQNEFWLEKYLNSPFAREYFAGSSKQTTNLASINKTQLRGCVIAVPPINEQNKIIEKIDELMIIFEYLKSKIQDTRVTQFTLVDELVNQAVV